MEAELGGSFGEGFGCECAVVEGEGGMASELDERHWVSIVIPNKHRSKTLTAAMATN
jgi:hypothetical protein